MSKHKPTGKTLHSFFWPFMLFFILIFFFLTTGETRLINLNQSWLIVFYILCAITVFFYIIESRD